ncbi:MAG: hypothetical protein U5K56_01345 [Halioglobus sp.]|nr:hypothetical protein [Halioglobus sp.]
MSEPSARFNAEVPGAGFRASGVSMVRGWACDAKTVQVQFDDMPLIDVAYGTSREDTRAICDDAANGYGMVMNWGLLDSGVHRMRTFIDGREVADVSFEVAGLDEEFIKGLSGIYRLDDFPHAGDSVDIEWSEPGQNFIILR